MAAKRRRKPGWRQCYPVQLLEGVVLLMARIPGFTYQEALQEQCAHYGVEYRH